MRPILTGRKVHTERDRHLRRALEDKWAFISSSKGEVQFIKEENIAYDKTWWMVWGEYREGEKGIDIEDEARYKNYGLSRFSRVLFQRVWTIPFKREPKRDLGRGESSWLAFRKITHEIRSMGSAEGKAEGQDQLVVHKDQPTGRKAIYHISFE